VLDGTPIRVLIGYETVSNLALIAMAIALGASTRMHRLRTAQQERINQLTTDRAADQAKLRIQAERERFSRDLHDTVGHTMSVISLQAGVAEEAIGTDDRAAIAAVRRIRETSGRTLSDVRSLVRLLRSEPDHGGHSLAELDQLLDNVRGAGIEVTADSAADARELPRDADAVGYRVVQEALTNIVRHSGARHAYVSVRVSGSRLELIITDDGRGPVDGQAPGQGLIGMRERVRMLGGTLDSGPGVPKGFAVQASIPIGAA
jgi:signal transduction histidine kinase